MGIWMKFYGIKDSCCTDKNIDFDENTFMYKCKTCSRVFTLIPKKKDLENKIQDLEGKLNNLSKQLDQDPSKTYVESIRQDLIKENLMEHSLKRYEDDYMKRLKEHNKKYEDPRTRGTMPKGWNPSTGLQKRYRMNNYSFLPHLESTYHQEPKIKKKKLPFSTRVLLAMKLATVKEKKDASND